MNLDKKSIPVYLQRKKLLSDDEPIQIRAIGSGQKNLIYHISTPSTDLVLKQALSRVQVKERWWLDRKRIFNEKNCIETLAQILPPDVIPDVLLEDRTNFILVTTAPPKDAVSWEEELGGGRIDLQIAAQCGELLATVHNETANNRDLKNIFKETKPFEQLRIEPFYNRVVQAFPDLKKIIDAQARQLLKDRRSLVLADLRPRNVWIDNGQVYLVDFATAHFGNPSFDLAFYASDLCLRAMHHSIQKAAYLEAINVFWNAYFKAAEYEGAAEAEKTAVRDLGCLLLSATDGREPVDFFSESMEGLSRRIAQSLIFTELERIEDITEFINRTLIDG
jgi:5-methylthioribose kinase